MSNDLTPEDVREIAESVDCESQYRKWIGSDEAVTVKREQLRRLLASYLVLEKERDALVTAAALHEQHSKQHHARLVSMEAQCRAAKDMLVRTADEKAALVAKARALWNAALDALRAGLPPEGV